MRGSLLALPGRVSALVALVVAATMIAPASSGAATQSLRFKNPHAFARYVILLQEAQGNQMRCPWQHRRRVSCVETTSKDVFGWDFYKVASYTVRMCTTSVSTGRTRCMRVHSRAVPGVGP